MLEDVSTPFSVGDRAMPVMEEGEVRRDEDVRSSKLKKNMSPQKLATEVCVSVWIMKVGNPSLLRRSSHGKSWRCGYGPRRLRHGGGQGWRYQGCKGGWMMLDPDKQVKWLRFLLQQVMLCDIIIHL